MVLASTTRSRSLYNVLRPDPNVTEAKEEKKDREGCDKARVSEGCVHTRSKKAANLRREERKRRIYNERPKDGRLLGLGLFIFRYLDARVGELGGVPEDSLALGETFPVLVEHDITLILNEL